MKQEMKTKNMQYSMKYMYMGIMIGENSIMYQMPFQSKMNQVSITLLYTQYSYQNHQF